jgi:hypothetical protein
MSLRGFLLALLFAVALLFAGVFAVLYHLAPVYWGVDRYAGEISERLPGATGPPEEIPIAYREQLDRIVKATLEALLPPPTLPGPTSTPFPTVPPPPSATPIPSATITPSPTAEALPAYVALTGVRNQVETRNNCGPATLAMALSFWGWEGDQTVIQAALRPNPRVDDKNVMPEEMARYAHEAAGLSALIRVGGDVDALRRLIAAGFPVIVEKGHITTGWIGHYLLLTGYDDPLGRFLSQDSLIVAPDAPVPYEELAGRWWRHFNYLYLIIYPPEREPEVLSILGPDADPSLNLQHAAEKARQEIAQSGGRELFFAWYNLGTSLVGLGDYPSAAQAYDAAYKDVYPALKKEKRPWRAPWYQTGPYLAYYHTGRYQDVIDLANATLATTGAPILVESLYWRGKAREALGDLPGALDDYQAAYDLNPNSTPALDELQRLGR